MIEETYRNRTEAMRKRTAGNLPYPDAASCMLYAVTELGEMVDAWLRKGRPDDKRNNDRQPDAKHELGQFIVMVQSAKLRCDELGEGKKLQVDEQTKQQCQALYEAMVNTAHIIKTMGNGEPPPPFEWVWIQKDFHTLARLYGVDWRELEEEACAEFERKHAKEMNA